MKPESIDDYIARGGHVQSGSYTNDFGEGTKRGLMGPRGTCVGKRMQLSKGCPRCGGALHEYDGEGGVAAVACEWCGDCFRSATGDMLKKLSLADRQLLRNGEQ